jgi:hypothetical protein
MRVIYRRVLECMIGFIDTQLVITGNYSAIANLRTLEFTVTHALEFSAFTSRILVTNLNKIDIPVSQIKSSLHSQTHFFAFLFNCLRLSSSDSLNSLLQLPTPELNSI